ncbi:MAG: glutamate-5-semialdehyde dehydrogenase, partial [Actinomycetota bacterium]
VPRHRAGELVPEVLGGLDDAAAGRGVNARLHVVEGSESYVPAERFERRVAIARAGGDVIEPAASSLPAADLATEWEWESSPEMTLVVVESVEEAVELCNTHSPRFVASLISDDPAEHDAFYASVDAPFVGNGFTRWVDGQYALDQPELGLSNWENGRMLGRGGVLSGDSVHTIRFRAIVDDHDTHR